MEAAAAAPTTSEIRKLSEACGTELTGTRDRAAVQKTRFVNVNAYNFAPMSMG